MKINKNQDITYIKLNKKDGQQFIDIIKNNFKNTQTINHRFKTLYENDYVLYPLISNQELIDRMKNVVGIKINYEFISKIGIPNENYKYKTLQEALEDNISNMSLELIPKSYDIIGDIAIIEFDKFKAQMSNIDYLDFKDKIAKAIIDVNTNVKAVYEKKSEVKGKFRLRELALLHGEDKSETIHKENDCTFKLDIKNTYFTPRLVFERRRVASSAIMENELIIDMFAGVGPFSIQIAKNQNVKIYAFDLNPDAYRYLKENITLNKLKGEIFPYHVDIKNLLEPTNQLGQSLMHKVDRLIMNLPESSINFIDAACFLMKESGGILHFYQFSEKPNPIEKTLMKLENELRTYNWEIESILTSKIVKHYSPKSELVVVDLKIKALK
ncbi:MAG: class I SAM-dependent methyltransferase family protein [Promethearchaeota archaeon]